METTDVHASAKITPKDFFLWAGAMIALYWSVIAFINLFCDYIDHAYPDPLTASYIDITSGSVRFEMSSLIVLTPVFLGLMYLIRRTIQIDPTRADVWVRRWSLYFTVFVAAITIIGTFIFVLNDFLEGTLATPFLLKSTIIVAVAAIGLMHFIADIWGYWRQKPQYARSVAYAVVALVVLTVAAGFVIYGTPQQARLYRFDNQKVNDLDAIQAEVITYWHNEGKLPDQLNVLNDPLNDVSIPHDPQTNAMYEYRHMSTTTFMLCAQFNAETQPGSNAFTAYDIGKSWNHEAGHDCFVRTIDPKRFSTDTVDPIPVNAIK